MSENTTKWQPTEYIEGEPVVPLRGNPPAELRRAAEARAKASREGRDVRPTTTPDTGMVQR